MIRNLLAVAFVGALATGCYSEEGVGVGYSYGYAGPSPALVEVSPGVQVIADYDYPIFYSDGYYWRQDGGVWYRSGYYNGGWAVSYNVPVGVRRIDRPYAYAHYRGNAGYYNGGGYRPVNGYRPAPVYGGGPAVRDHRTYSAPVARPAPVYRAPAVRDHRR